MDMKPLPSHWTYFMIFCSNYNTHSLYHFENSAIVAWKNNDIVTFYTCQMNKGDIWHQFKKYDKFCQMALLYRNIKTQYGQSQSE